MSKAVAVNVDVVVGDALASLRALPDRTFQTCVTSPPYFQLRDYQVDGQIGLEATPDAYVGRLVEVFREVRRTLRDDGTLWLNLGDSYAGSWGAQSRSDGNATVSATSAAQAEAAPKRTHTGSVKHLDGIKPKDLLGVPWMVAFALRADGWFLRAGIVWAKPNPMPESVTDRPTRSHEHVFLLSKSPRYFYDADAVREAEAVPDWDDGIRVFGGKNKAGANVAHGDRTTGRVAGPRKRGVPPQDAQHEVSDESVLDWVPRGGGRNARDVWTIATRPFGGAHYATMPPDLAERCVRAGTSEAGQCAACGAPLRRVPSVVGQQVTEAMRAAGCDAQGSYGGQGQKAYGEAGVQNPSDVNRRILARMAEVREHAWKPLCSCPRAAPVPQRVLDPFGGAGTTGLVAHRLQRRATLIEINPAYADLARSRIRGDAPLLHDAIPEAAAE